jgi:ankyrin repeat protein
MNDLVKERLATLVRELATATAAGAAEWQASEPDVYVWRSAQGAVSVASRDRDGDPPFELVVFNAGDERVDELASELLEDDQPAPWNDDLLELYRLARRSALRADDVIEALIAALPTAGGDNADQDRSLLDRVRESMTPTTVDES